MDQHLFFNPRFGVVCVKTGFSWPACIFGALWAMAHRMWVPHAVVLLALEVAFWTLAGIAHAQANAPLAWFVFVAGWMLVVARGQYGNQWLAESLRRRGYTIGDAWLRMA